MTWTTADNDYCLEEMVHGEISTVEDLIDWMEDSVDRYESKYGEFEEGSEIKGRGYIAGTIKYHSEKGLVQTGSAPGFFGDIWTLCTCRKDIRSSSNFVDAFREEGDGVYRPTQPVFILPFSSRRQAYDKPGKKYQRALTSAALVTHGFRDMGRYARFLVNNFSGESVEKRLSHGGNSVAEERGDCHADWDGEVHYPPDGHQHGEDSPDCGCSTSSARSPTDHIDNQTHHIKCLSMPGYWISWNKPTLAMDLDNEFRQKNFSSSTVLQNRIEPVGKVVNR